MTRRRRWSYGLTFLAGFAFGQWLLTRSIAKRLRRGYALVPYSDLTA